MCKRQKRILSIILCFCLVFQMFSSSVTMKADAAVSDKDTVNLLEALNTKGTPNIDGFESIGIKLTDSEKQPDGSYQSNMTLTNKLKDSYLNNVKENTECGPFKEVYAHYAGDIQNYIETALIQYDQDGTHDSENLIDFTQLKDLEYSIKLDKSYRIIFGDGEQLNKKIMLSKEIEGKNYDLGYILVTQNADLSYTLHFSMNKIVYVLNNVSCGCTMKLGMDASEDAGKIPSAQFNKDNLSIDFTYKAAGDDHTPGTNDPSYLLDKNAVSSTSDNYIDYSFTVTGKYGANLNGTVIKDVIPTGFEVVDVQYLKSGAPSVAGTYKIEAGTLYISLPKDLTATADADKVMKAEYLVRMQLNQETYQTALQNGSYVKKINNKASLLNPEKNKTLTKQDASVNTDMNYHMLTKNGQQDPYNGTKMNWTLGFDLYGTRCDDAFVIDTLDAGSHMYAKNQDLTYQDITINCSGYTGKESVTMPVKTTSYQEGYEYDSVTVEKIKALALLDQCAYVYSYMAGTEKKAVMLIPVAEYLNKGNTTIQYATDIIYAEGEKVDDHLGSEDGNLTLGNDARMIWKNYYYGTGPVSVIDQVNFNIHKDVDIIYSYGTKSAAGSYNEKERSHEWKFVVNQYGAVMPDTIVEDELVNSVQVYDDSILSETANIEAEYKDRDDQTKSGTVYIPGIQASKDANGGVAVAPYYEVTNSADKTKLVIHFGDLSVNDYYQFNIKTYVKDINIIGNNITEESNILLNNNAKISISNGVDGRKENSLEASSKAKNTIISKDNIDFSNDKRIYEYDYENRALKWRVTVNENHTPITNEVIKDTLPEGSAFGRVTKAVRYAEGSTEPVEGAIANDGSNKITFSDDITFTTDATEEGFVKFISDVNHDAAAENDGMYIFEFTTQLTEAYEQANWLNNEEHDVINNVSLTGKIFGKDIAVDAKDDAIHTIKSDELFKTGNYNEEDHLVDWSMVINQNGLDIGGYTIADDLTGTLMEFVENSDDIKGVSVEQLTVGADGSYQVNEDSAVVAQMNHIVDGINASIASNDDLKFSYTIPTYASYKKSTLRITLKTFMTEDVAVSSLKNQAKLALAGGNAIETGEVQCQGNQEYDLDEYVTGSKAPILQMIKESNNVNDEEENQIELGGAKFDISQMSYDADHGIWNTSPVKIRSTNGRNGSALFMNLKRGIIYKVVETKAPDGYALDTTPKYLLYENDSFHVNSLPVSAWSTLDSYQEANRIVIAQGTNNALIHITDIPLDSSKIEFTKVGPENELIEGAVFELTDNAGRVKKQTITSDVNGIVTFEHLDPGTYTLKETYSPSYYARIEQNMTVSLAWNKDANEGAGAYEYTITGSDAISGTQGNYQIRNKIAKAAFTLVKKDNVTNELLSGVEFTLKDDLDNSNVQTASTDANGKIAFQNISADTTYTLTETKQKGYQNDTQSYAVSSFVDHGTTVKVSITPKHGTENIIGDKATFVITNTPITEHNTITATKYDDEGNILEGAEFALYKVINGTKQEDTAYTAQSDPDGKIVFSDVTYGNYVLAETNAPDGYVKSNTDISITKSMISDDMNVDDISFAYIVPSEIHNAAIRNTVSLIKTAKGDNTKKVSGAEFTVYDASSNQAVAYLVEGDTAGHYELSDQNAAGNTVTNLKNSKNVTYLVKQAGIFKLVYGDYYVQETTTPEGYIKQYEGDGVTLKKTAFSITRGDEDQLISNAEDAHQEEYLNVRALGSLNIDKQIESANQHITERISAGAGYTFKISGKNLWGESIETQKNLRADGNTMEKNTGSITVKTNSDGKIILSGLEPSDAAGYVVEELEVPGLTDAFVLPAAQNVMLTMTDNTIREQNLIFENKLKKSDITGLKMNDESRTLAGAEFGLFTDDVTEYKTDNLFQNNKATSDSNGKFKFSGIPYGNYKIVELRAPQGHITSDRVAKVSITEDGQVINKDKNDQELTFINQLAKQDFTIIKKDSYTQKVLAGVTFDLSGNNVYGTSCHMEATTSDEGTASFADLAAGTYTLIERKQTGYEQGDSFTVIVSVDQNQPKLAIRNNTTNETLSTDESGKYLITNTPISQNNNRIILKKCDQDGNAVSGCTFGLFREGYLEEGIGETPDYTAVSDMNGDVVFDNVIFSGYTLKELLVPEGYAKADNVTFSKADIITQCNMQSEDTAFTYDIGTVSNVLSRGTVGLVKTDSNDHSRLSGAEFGIYTEQECNNKIAKLTETAEEGRYALDQLDDAEYPDNSDAENQYGSKLLVRDVSDTCRLAYGTYYMKEEKAPKGYLIDKNIYPFAITQDGDSVQLKNNTELNEFENDKSLGTFRFFSFMQRVGKFNIEKQSAVAGIKYMLQGKSILGNQVQDQSSLAGDNYIVHEDGIEIQTNEFGEFSLWGLEVGDYLLTQLSVDFDHDYLLSDPVTFHVGVDETTNQPVDASVEVVNQLKNDDVKGVVKTDSGVSLKHIRVGLFRSDVENYSVENVFNHYVYSTDDNGYFNFENVPVGEYVVAQIDDSEGYHQMTRTIPVKVTGNSDKDAQNQTLQLLNEPAPMTNTLENVNGNNIDNVTDMIQQNGKELDTAQTNPDGTETGDQAPIILLVILLFISSTFIMYTGMKKKRYHNQY